MLRVNRLARALSVSGLLCVLALQLIHVARATSSTWDEPHHLFDGYTIFKSNDYRLNPEVPPFVKLTAAVPLLRMHLNVPENQGRPIPLEAFLDGRSFVFGNGGDRILFPARMACMGFTLALGLLIYLAAEEMFGVLAGLFALALFVMDPNFLANGALVTTDVGSACCFLAAIYSFYRYCRKPGWMRLALSGFAMGLGLVAKFTGIFLVPMLFLIVVLEGISARSARVFWRRLGALAVAGTIAWVVLWSFYGFRYKAAPDGHELVPALAPYLAMMYDQRDAHILGVLATHHALPEAYIWGLENTKNIAYEDASYFWGKVYLHGNWAYFPVSFLIKSTLPFLILLCLLFLAWSWGLKKRTRELGFLFIPVVVYFAISMSSSMDIGFRHLLSVYPFLYIAIGGTAATLMERDFRWSAVLTFLLCWQIVTSYRVAPAYMAYGNEAWGGPSKVDRYLGDANTDWGQQLKAVKAYLDQRHITNCWFAYFPDGAIQISDYGIRCKRLPTSDSLGLLHLPMKVPSVIDGTVLISAGDLEGIELGDGPLNPYESFRQTTPTAVIQHSVYVYDGSFAVPLAAALVASRDALKLADEGKLPEALQCASDAVRLAPGSATVQAAMGDVMAAAGKNREALAHYEAALQNTRTVRPDLQEDEAEDLQGKIERLPRPPP
jgi:hypothetical protein